MLEHYGRCFIRWEVSWKRFQKFLPFESHSALALGTAKTSSKKEPEKTSFDRQNNFTYQKADPKKTQKQKIWENLKDSFLEQT